MIGGTSPVEDPRESAKVMLPEAGANYGDSLRQAVTGIKAQPTWTDTILQPFKSLAKTAANAYAATFKGLTPSNADSQAQNGCEQSNTKQTKSPQFVAFPLIESRESQISQVLASTWHDVTAAMQRAFTAGVGVFGERLNPVSGFANPQDPSSYAYKVYSFPWFGGERGLGKMVENNAGYLINLGLNRQHNGSVSASINSLYESARNKVKVVTEYGLSGTGDILIGAVAAVPVAVYLVGKSIYNAPKVGILPTLILCGYSILQAVCLPITLTYRNSAPDRERISGWSIIKNEERVWSQMEEKISGVNAGLLDKRVVGVLDDVSPDGDRFDANLDYTQGEGGRVVVTEGAKERISGRQTHGFFTNGSARDLEEGQSLKEDGYMGATSSSNSSYHRMPLKCTIGTCIKSTPPVSVNNIP